MIDHSSSTDVFDNRPRIGIPVSKVTKAFFNYQEMPIVEYQKRMSVIAKCVRYTHTLRVGTPFFTAEYAASYFERQADGTYHAHYAIVGVF